MPNPGERFDRISTDADVWTPDTVTGMLENLGDAQLRFIRLLASDDRQMTSKEIVQKLKLDSEVAFAGVLSGLSKQLKHIGLKPQQLYWVVVAWTGKTKTRSFALFDRFKAVANEIGWPDHWPAMKGAQNAASTKLPRFAGEAVHLGPSVQFRNGCYQANARTLARAEGIKKLQAIHQWVDIADLRIFLMGFDAGEEYCSIDHHQAAAVKAPSAKESIAKAAPSLLELADAMCRLFFDQTIPDWKQEVTEAARAYRKARGL
jgi:hypothetical protein